MSEKPLKQYNVQYFQNGKAIGPEWFFASRIYPTKQARDNRPYPDYTYEIYESGTKERPIEDERVLREMAERRGETSW